MGLLEVIGYFFSYVQRHIPSPAVGSLVVIKATIGMQEKDGLLELRLIEVLDCLTLLRIDSQCWFLTVILDPKHLAPGSHKRKLFINVSGGEVRLLSKDQRILVLNVLFVEILGVPKRIYAMNKRQIHPQLRPSTDHDQVPIWVVILNGLSHCSGCNVLTEPALNLEDAELSC
jgi:hypothetical protein